MVTFQTVPKLNTVLPWRILYDPLFLDLQMQTKEGATLLVILSHHQQILFLEVDMNTNIYTKK